MGLTQSKHAVITIQQIVNLLLLKGNIGKPGAGLVPCVDIVMCKVIVRWVLLKIHQRFFWML